MLLKMPGNKLILFYNILLPEKIKKYFILSNIAYHICFDIHTILFIEKILDYSSILNSLNYQ